MRVLVEVRATSEAPPRGAPVIVEVRDTGVADAPAQVLGRAVGSVAGESGGLLATVAVEVASLGGRATVWALVDANRDGRVSKGDFVTTQSYVVPTAAEPHVQVAVTRV